MEGQSQQFIMIILMVLFIVFFMVIPQRKRAKKEKEFEANLKVGDRIVTKSGIHGRIAELSETTIVLETMAGKLKMEKAAISPELTQKLQKTA